MQPTVAAILLAHPRALLFCFRITYLYQIFIFSKLPANYQHIKFKYITNANTRPHNIKLSLWQVTGKLIYAHTGIYFIYLGAVCGSRTLINHLLIASFINIEELLDDVSGKQNKPCNYAIRKHTFRIIKYHVTSVQVSL